MAEAIESTESIVLGGGPPRGRRILSWIGWGSISLVFLIAFTIAKLPQTRMKNFIQGMISSQLASEGIGFTADQGELSLGLGISYQMKGITLTPRAPAPPIRIDELRVAPSLLSPLTGNLGGTIWIRNSGGSIKITGSSAASRTRSDFSFQFEAEKMDLGKLGILPLLAHVEGSAMIEGSGSLSGDLNNPSTWNGDIHLNLSRIVIAQQSIQGFSIPKLTDSEGKIELAIDHGKAVIRAFKLGKAGSQDDIIATLTGDIMLGKQLPASTLALQARFKLSDKILKAFSLIDALLGAGKQPDGSYAFSLNGPLTSPIPQPIGAH
jgi:type II secretion system protein N